MKKIIEIRDLSFEYGEHKVFEKFSLDIEDGSFYTVLGSNGSGKSTLTKIIVGLEPSRGFVKIDGLFLNPKNIDEIRKVVSVVFENPDSQFITESVEEELAFTLENLNYDKTEIVKRIREIAKKMGITHLLERNPHELSGGEKQLVAFASALIHDPKILILDEALVMVDLVLRDKIYDILKEYHKKGLTILNITHDSEESLLGTHVLIMNKGEIILNEKTKIALENDKAFKLGGMDLPFIIDLSVKLKYYGIVSKTSFDSKKLVNAIWK
jgi:ABC-type cobalt transport system, ATPase component